MARNSIELNIGTKYDGDGMRKLNAALKGASAGFGRTTRSVAGVVDAMSGMDGAIGKTAGKIGSLASQFMQGGVFGVAMGIASMAIAKLTEHFSALKKSAANAAEYLRSQFSAAIGDVDARSAKLVANFQKANTKVIRQLGRDNQNVDAVKRAENTVVAQRQIVQNNAAARGVATAGVREAKNNLAKAEEDAMKYLIARQQAQDRIANIEERTFADAKTKILALNAARAAAKKVEEDYAEDAKQLKAARDALAKAEERLTAIADEEEESILDLTAANDNLAAIKKKEADKEAKKKAEDDEKWKDQKIAWEEQIRMAEEEAESERQLRDANLKIAKIREAKEKERQKIQEESEKKVKELDKKIAKAKEEAAKLEEAAARARGGKTFGEWQRGERKIARDKKREDIRQRNVIENAKKEIGRLEDERRRFGKGFNPQRAKRLAQLREFVNDQDPKNNPAIQKAEALEAQKVALMQKTKDNLDAIAAQLKNGITL